MERAGIGPPVAECLLSTERLSTLDKSPFHHGAETKYEPVCVVHFTPIRYSLIQLAFPPPAWCRGRMPIAASDASVKWHPSIAARRSSPRESTISQEEQSLKLSGWIKESRARFTSTPCWHFYRLPWRWMQTLEGGKPTETHDEHVQTEFLAGASEWVYFSTRTWVRGIFLFFVARSNEFPSVQP